MTTHQSKQSPMNYHACKNKGSDTKDPFWTLHHVMQALGCSCDDVLDKPIHEISIDSRTIMAGDLYIALIGKTHNGHAFVKSAIQNGAKVVIVENDYTQNSDLQHLAHANNVTLIGVDDTLQALHDLARFSRSKTKAKIIAITGSVGKTTTKEMLNHVLQSFGETVCAKGSFNNHWGVPLSMIHLRPETKFAIFEVGMNNYGEILPLAQLIQPHIAIITAIADAHIGQFQNPQDIAIEKSSIFEGLTPYHPNDSHSHNNQLTPLLKDPFAILHQGTQHFKLLREKALLKSKLCLCSRDATTHISDPMTSLQMKAYSIIEDTTSPIHTTTAHIQIHDQAYSLTLPVIGQHYLDCALSVISVANLLNLDMECVIALLETVKLPKGRGDTHIFPWDDGEITIVNDSYNANPTSMETGLINFSNRFKGSKSGSLASSPRLIVVLGHMLELGDKTDFYHNHIAHVVKSLPIDSVFCCGENMKTFFDHISPDQRQSYRLTAKELRDDVIPFIKKGDIIYIKGSNGSRVFEIFDELCARSQT